MAACEACKALHNQRNNVEAHPALAEGSSYSLGRRTMGQASGLLTNYRCSNCGTEMACDGDTKDKDAGWYITKEG